MLEIRIHGRGGQGNVAAAYLMADTAFRAGHYAQAFPAFGAERRGAPVSAFVRLAARPVRRRCAVREPHVVIVQDPTLLADPATLAGLRRDGGLLVNARAGEAPKAGRRGRGRRRIVALPATALAREILGRAVPNVALLTAFFALTGLAPLAALADAVSARFPPPVAERNRRLIDAAAKTVTPGAWQEIAHHGSD